jgi:hypothetical protein
MVTMFNRPLPLGLLLCGLALQGCNTQRTVAPPEQTFDLYFCALKPVTQIDNTRDGVFDVGDAMAYTATLSRQPSCLPQEQTVVFSALEEVVQRPKQQPDGSRRFLSNFQGTLKLDAGTLQLRGLQSFVLSGLQKQQLEAGKTVMSLAQILPEQDTFTVVGGGAGFAGLVGTAGYQPLSKQAPASLRLTLFRQARN